MLSIIYHSFQSNHYDNCWAIIKPNIQYMWVKLHIQLHKMWDKVEVKRNNNGIDELKAGDVTNNIFGTESHCLTHRPGRAPPQRSLFCWDLSCGHICSTQQHHILSWVYGFRGQRVHRWVPVVTQMIGRPNRREESCFPKALMIHCWPYKQCTGTIECSCQSTYCMYQY